MKLALALHHRTIPPNLHHTEPNPRIPFDEYKLRVPTEVMPWESTNPDGALHGGVNSFGFGGTNAHAVLSSAPAAVDSPAVQPNSAPQVWTVSARSQAALLEAARNDAEFLKAADPANFPAIAGAVRERRSHHPYRLAVVADDALTAIEKLSAFASGQTPAGVYSGHVSSHAMPVAIVFSGQGTQWPAMARDLYQENASFRATVEELDAIMKPSWGRSLIEEICRGDDSIYQSDIGQPVLFALQVGVYRLYAEWGIDPLVVLGHSFGEVAAAHAAGALSLAAAAQVIVERAKALELTSGAGVMAAVGLSEAEAEELIAKYPNWLSIAAYNSATDLTLSGDEKSIKAAVEIVTAKGRFARILPFPYAFHSQAVEGCREVFTRAIAGLPASAPVIPFVSTVTSRELTDEIPDEKYWWRNLRQPVRFSAAVSRAAELGAKVFLEVGPHPGLIRYVGQVVNGVPETLILGSLRRNEPGPKCLAESVAALHVRGVEIDWARLTPGSKDHMAFPHYPWQRQPFWIESPDSKHRRLSSPTHPLLGLREIGSAKEWESCLSTDQFPYLADHGFRSRAVFPAAGHVELMLAATSDGQFDKPIGLYDVNCDRILWADEPHIVRTSFDPTSRRVSVAARPVGNSERGWEVVSRGIRWAADASGAERTNPGNPLHPADAVRIPAEALYSRFERAGHHYGPMFRTVREMWSKGSELWAEVTLDPALHGDSSNYYMHPALLDGVFQSALQATPVDEEREAMFLPVRLERIEWRQRAGTSVLCHVRNVHVQDTRWFVDIEIFSPEGEWIATFAGCCCVKKPQEAHIARSKTKLFQETWKPVAISTEKKSMPAAWLVIDPANQAADLIAQLSELSDWVGHHTDGSDLMAEFLTRGQGSKGIIVWSAGEPVEAPSTDGVIKVLEPLLKAAQALVAADLAEVSLWLVTSGATWGHDGTVAAPNLLQAPAAGLLRTVATELPRVICRLLDLDPADTAPVATALSEIASQPAEDEIAYRGGKRFAAQLQTSNPDTLAWRSLPATQTAAATFQLQTTSPGSLDGLAWVSIERPAPAAHEIEIEVRAIGLNFRDVLKALDIYPLAPTEPRSFGDECAGVVVRVGSAVTEFKPGDEVLAVAAYGFGNRIRVASVLAAKKPANLTFEQAATIPIAFLTADYCLSDVARLEAGESVLIHAAAGGVGQAAIQIARQIGAEIFGTASPEKHEFLRFQGVKHIFHSRNLSFADGVRETTGGRGVDVVLNSLAGEFIPRSLELLSPGGRFVEIGKKDIFQNTSIDLAPFRSSVSFHAVDLSAVVQRKPQWIGRRLRAIVANFESGAYTPIPSLPYAAQNVDDAFRLMAQGKHRGKVVVTSDPVNPPTKILSHTQPVVRADASYLITGGLSGLGLRTAQWLAQQADVERLIHNGDSNRPPLKGIIHSAMVLQDEPLPKIERASLEKVLAPKIAGSWNLHLATRNLPLDWFVMYSSVATILGSAAQGSYVVGNRFLDALAWQRRAEGLPALAVNWGPLAEVGIVADNKALTRYLEAAGLDLLAPAEVFTFLKYLLRRDVTTSSVLRIDWTKYAATNQACQKSFRMAAVLEQPAEGVESTAGSDVLAALMAKSADARPAFLLAHLRHALAAVLRADDAAMDPSAPLTSFGVDSLMAFEFKLRIDRDFKVNLPIDQMSAGATLTELSALLLRQLTTTREDAPSATPVKESAPKAVPAPPIVAAKPAAAAPIEPVADDGNQRVLTRSGARSLLKDLKIDAAALMYVPDRISTVGGLNDEQIGILFGNDPFISHVYDLPIGRIGVITLPIRGKEMFGSPRVEGLVRKAGDMARKYGAKCLSLTGLIPSATDYGKKVSNWLAETGLKVTTGHATTTAAVVLNLESMLDKSDRFPGSEHLAILGLGSIGQSCLALALDTLPHPRELTLCDVFAKKDEVNALARGIRERHGFRGPIRVLASERGLPDALYEATTILTAVSIPDVIDVDRLRPGTIIVDDSYPPGFSLSRAIARSEAEGDLFFGNAGMVRVAEPIGETIILPRGSEDIIAAFGKDDFLHELIRDPNELTACILSSLLTQKCEGFTATIGLASLADLQSHHRGLIRLGIEAARPQCGTYFVPDDVIRRFRSQFAANSPDGRPRLVAEPR
ncbi:MAG: type I polyketide synthase [Planctomycetes bacterium]|nr:type I polyketide synthase [Planctomycetota bacterium]